MPLSKCRYCTREVDSKSLMRHYTQTGCLKRAKLPTSLPALPRQHRNRHHVPSTLSPTRPSESNSFSLRSNSPPLSDASDPPEAGGPTRSTLRYPRVWVEEVADSGDFPRHTRIVDVHPTAGVPLGPTTFKTVWENRREAESKAGNPPWMSFESEEEWDLARFLMKSGLSQEKINELLQLKIVRHSLDRRTCGLVSPLHLL